MESHAPSELRKMNDEDFFIAFIKDGGPRRNCVCMECQRYCRIWKKKTADLPKTRVRSEEQVEVMRHAARLVDNSEARKAIPMTTGLLDYFPDALAMVATVSFLGNQKHNPGEPMHHARGKSMDHADCIARHLVDRDADDPDTGLPHAAFMAWRSLAYLQELLEKRHGLPLPRGASL